MVNCRLKSGGAILAAYDRGEIPVLANPMILTEGWDCQICSCVMLLRISSHKSTMIQMVGRGLRKLDPRRYPGRTKRDCLVLDFGISLLTHGDLNADVRLKYKEFKDKDAEARKKKCPDCGAIIPIQVRECLLCGYQFKVEITEEGFYDEIEELRLIEIDLLNKSPFRWTSLFPSDQVLVACGFNTWAAVCSVDHDNWFAIGGGEKRPTELLTIANKIGAVASADDFMRQNEKSTSAKKAAFWMTQPASQKQMQVLARFGYEGQFSKIEAAAHMTFQFNRKSIEQILGVA